MFHQLLRPAQVHLIPQNQRQLLSQIYIFRLLCHLQHQRVVLSNRFRLNRRFPRPQLSHRTIPLLQPPVQQRLTVLCPKTRPLPPAPRLRLRLYHQRSSKFIFDGSCRPRSRSNNLQYGRFWNFFLFFFFFLIIVSHNIVFVNHYVVKYLDGNPVFFTSLDIIPSSLHLCTSCCNNHLHVKIRYHNFRAMVLPFSRPLSTKPTSTNNARCHSILLQMVPGPAR
jgi:hypothetical protein